MSVAFDLRAQRRILHLPNNTRAVAVLDERRARARDQERGFSHDLWSDLPDMLESLAARGIVHDDWTHEERVEALRQDLRASSLVLRNPEALITAERLLLDNLARCSQEHGSPVGRYIGVRSWETLCSYSNASERGRDVPHTDSPGYRTAAHAKMTPQWVSAVKDAHIGDGYGGPGNLLWSMADQIATGAPWLVSLYETGFGLWSWHHGARGSEWALIVRSGDGLPWPEYIADTAAARA